MLWHPKQDMHYSPNLSVIKIWYKAQLMSYLGFIYSVELKNSHQNASEWHVIFKLKIIIKLFYSNILILRDFYLFFPPIGLSCNIMAIITKWKNCEYYMKSMIKLFSILLAILTLVGCGLKGPLYYPNEQSRTFVQSNDVSNIA